jgi:UDP-N-acetylmuramate dehydrogenase
MNSDSKPHSISLVLPAFLSSEILYDEPLARHTTFRIGGPAAAWVVANSKDDLKAALTHVRVNNLPWKVIGKGSNLLVSDQGFPGIVVLLGMDFRTVAITDTTFQAGAGLAMADALTQAVGQGLSGLEFMWGIPGTLGGGIRTNAGAFDHDMAEIITGVQVVSLQGIETTLTRRDIKFDYRRSSLPDDCVVTGVTMKLKHSSRSIIESRLAAFRERRQAKQPRGASAGSVFKNPEGKAAGRLIDQAGLKGRRVGDAVVSDRHANFIINEGKARCSDVRQLMEIIKQKVEEKFGIILEEEIEVVSG